MNQKQFRSALEKLGVTRAEAAVLLGYGERAIAGYANGAPIPLLVERFLNLLIKTETRVDRYL